VQGNTYHLDDAGDEHAIQSLLARLFVNSVSSEEINSVGTVAIKSDRASIPLQSSAAEDGLVWRHRHVIPSALAPRSRLLDRAFSSQPSQYRSLLRATAYIPA
jgi:hypothetical protein